MGKKRSVGAALLLSLALYPGAGQLYNGNYALGVALGLLFTLPALASLWILIKSLLVVFGPLIELQEPGDPVAVLRGGIPWFLVTFAIYVAAAIEAGVSAHRASRSREPAEGSAS
ncbi:MAG TPA: hypothetical protein VNO81_07195 [Candidatus Nitrosotenuis sp.]|nr:hypothetical protein [Candidatus Nitrosotenuis sp.]